MFQGDDELNACYMDRVESCVVGDEEVDAGRRRACQLYRVGCQERSVGP
jgi:hypothetical protein